MAQQIRFTSDDGDAVEIVVTDEGVMLTVIEDGDEGGGGQTVSLDAQSALLLANTIWDLVGEEDDE